MNFTFFEFVELSCCIVYLSFCHRTASDAKLLDNSRNFLLQLLLRVWRNPHLLRSFQWSNVLVDLFEFLLTEFVACSKPPSRNNYHKVSYPRMQQCDQGGVEPESCNHDRRKSDVFTLSTTLRTMVEIKRHNFFHVELELIKFFVPKFTSSMVSWYNPFEALGWILLFDSIFCFKRRVWSASGYRPQGTTSLVFSKTKRFSEHSFNRWDIFYRFCTYHRLFTLT